MGRFWLLLFFKVLAFKRKSLLPWAIVKKSGQLKDQCISSTLPPHTGPSDQHSLHFKSLRGSSLLLPLYSGLSHLARAQSKLDPWPTCVIVIKAIFQLGVTSLPFLTNLRGSPISYRLVGCVCVAGDGLGIFSHFSIPLQASTSSLCCCHPLS